MKKISKKMIILVAVLSLVSVLAFAQRGSRPAPTGASGRGSSGSGAPSSFRMGESSRGSSSFGSGSRSGSSIGSSTQERRSPRVWGDSNPQSATQGRIEQRTGNFSGGSSSGSFGSRDSMRDNSSSKGGSSSSSSGRIAERAGDRKDSDKRGKSDSYSFGFGYNDGNTAIGGSYSSRDRDRGGHDRRDWDRRDRDHDRYDRRDWGRDRHRDSHYSLGFYYGYPWWGFSGSYVSRKYGVYVNTYPAPVYTYRPVWVPGYWKRVYDTEEYIGAWGEVCYRTVARDVWVPGYWQY